MFLRADDASFSGADGDGMLTLIGFDGGVSMFGVAPEAIAWTAPGSTIPAAMESQTLNAIIEAGSATYAVALSEAEYDQNTRSLTFSLESLEDLDDARVTSGAAAFDALTSGSLGAVSVFIDPATVTTCTLTITGPGSSDVATLSNSSMGLSTNAHWVEEPPATFPFDSSITFSLAPCSTNVSVEFNYPIGDHPASSDLSGFIHFEGVFTTSDEPSRFACVIIGDETPYECDESGDGFVIKKLY